MSFLNPAILWLLPFIAVPVIIHLLAKRKSKLIDFPSLKFLKLLEQDALKKFNIKQLLLLLLRTLMVLLLILAFSRPTLNLDSDSGLSLRSNRLAILLLDNTASTSDYFEELSGPWIDELSTQLEEKGYSVHFADLERLNLSKDRASIRSGYGCTFPDNFSARFDEQISLERFTDKVLVWIGDGQGLGLVANDLTDWEIFGLNEPPFEDFGIGSIQLPRSGLQFGQEYSIELELSNSSTGEAGQALDLFINEERQNQSVVMGGETNIALTAQVREPGLQIGSLTLMEDRYSFNNSRHFVIPAQGRIPFQILRRVASVDYWQVISRALEQQSINLDVRLVDPAQVDDLDLSRGGTVVVEDAALLADYSWSRLQGFLERGGRLIMFGYGGKKFEEILHFKGPLSVSQSRSSLLLNMTDTGLNAGLPAPLSEVLAEDRLKVFKRYVGTDNELSSTWVRYADDQPFMGQTNYAQGTVIWFNTDFDMAASNLPLLGVFPAIMLHFGQTVSNSDLTSSYNYLIGDTLIFQPESTSGSEAYSISRPDGTTDYASPDSNFVLAYAQADIPGLYSLSKGRKILQVLAVNIATEEVRAKTLSPLVSGNNLMVSTSKSDLVKSVLDNQSVLSIWPILLILLLLIWMLETYLSRIRKTWRQNE